MQQLLASSTRLRQTSWESKVRVCSMALHLQRHVALLGALARWRAQAGALGASAAVSYRYHR